MCHNYLYIEGKSFKYNVYSILRQEQDSMDPYQSAGNLKIKISYSTHGRSQLLEEQGFPPRRLFGP